jgi:hypothetical protein
LWILFGGSLVVPGRQARGVVWCGGGFGVRVSASLWLLGCSLPAAASVAPRSFFAPVCLRVGGAKGFFLAWFFRVKLLFFNVICCFLGGIFV